MLAIISFKLSILLTIVFNFWFSSALKSLIFWRILAILLLVAPVTPDAPVAAIFPPAVAPPSYVPPVVVLTPEQARADAIFVAQDVALFMQKPDAVKDAARAQKEITDALGGLVAPVAVVVV